MRPLPRLVRLCAWVALGNLAIFTLLRLAFWVWFRNPSDPLPTATLAEAFYLGMKFDLRLVALLLLPLLSMGWADRLGPFRRTGRLLWCGYLTLAFAWVMLLYALDFGHFAYLHTRVDQTIFRFLENAEISAGMVWESYPVTAITLGLATLVTLYGFWIARLTSAIGEASAPPRPWPSRLAWTMGTAALLLLSLYGKISWYPLRWSDAYFSSHSLASAVAVNPVLYLADTWLNRGVEADEAKVRANYLRVAAYLGMKQSEAAPLLYARHCSAHPLVAGRPNIVLVFLESFAAYKTGLFGNPLDPTPNFDALAREGMFFTNYFVPHTGTARSVFALVTGIPDVQVGETSSRNPMLAEQHTLLNAFTGYRKHYFLGGSASWGNIRALLANNVEGLEIHEEGSYRSPRVDVWGISDLDLFHEATATLHGERQPFLAIIQTAGNHRPYTIPQQNGGFVRQERPQEELQRYGFTSSDEFNAFRFMDHSVGRFIAEARQESWFDNTLFVFFGDHGIAGYAGFHRPPADTELDLGSYRVPLLFYAPKLLPVPKTFGQTVSELDILPTVASLTGHPYTNTTLGRDMFDPRFASTRYAFTTTYGGTPLIGVIGDGLFFRMRADGSEKGLYRLTAGDPREDVSASLPQRAAEMEQLTTALHETAKYLLNHNRRLPGEGFTSP